MGADTPLMVSAEFALAHTVDQIVAVEPVHVIRITTREGLPASLSGDKFRSMVIENYYTMDGELLCRQEVDHVDA